VLVTHKHDKLLMAAPSPASGTVVVAGFTTPTQSCWPAGTSGLLAASRVRRRRCTAPLLPPPSLSPVCRLFCGLTPRPSCPSSASLVTYNLPVSLLHSLSSNHPSLGVLVPLAACSTWAPTLTTHATMRQYRLTVNPHNCLSPQASVSTTARRAAWRRRARSTAPSCCSCPTPSWTGPSSPLSPRRTSSGWRGFPGAASGGRWGRGCGGGCAPRLVGALCVGLGFQGPCGIWAAWGVGWR
jgi:hypothetical protein